MVNSLHAQELRAAVIFDNLHFWAVGSFQGFVHALTRTTPSVLTHQQGFSFERSPFYSTFKIAFAPLKVMGILFHCRHNQNKRMYIVAARVDAGAPGQPIAGW
jgi:hypothetical protein